jgi:hypothetical protein
LLVVVLAVVVAVGAPKVKPDEGAVPLLLVVVLVVVTEGAPKVKPPVPVEGTTGGEELAPNANDDDEEGAETGTVEVAAVVVVATAVATGDDDPNTKPDVVPEAAAAVNKAPKVKPSKPVLLLLPLPVEVATTPAAATGREGTGA